MFFTRLNSAMSARRMAISSINSFRKSVSAAGTQKTTSKLQVWCYRLGLLASMKTLDSEIKAVETNMADRKYKPRVLVGLFDDSGITEIEEESEEDVTTETEREETA